jgi:hypothetical protein
MTGAEETERVINECASLLLLASPNPEPRPPTDPPHTSPALTTGQSGQRIKPCLCPCCRGGPRRKHAKWARSCRPTVGLSERHWAFFSWAFLLSAVGYFVAMEKGP